MSDHTLTLEFIADRLADATGSGRERAMADAKVLFCVMQSMGLIPQSALAVWEQDAKILELRGQGISGTMIAMRMGISRRTVFEAVNRHQAARRMAMRMVA